ncbi:MAG: division plane positioning ATPase MipZ [Gammaproteobacteria bacterium]
MATSAGEPGPHCITFVNEKGGTGKSTLAVHLLLSLSRLGHRVAALDLDFRQQTLSRYLQNRHNHHPRLPAIPVYAPPPSAADSRSSANQEDAAAIRERVESLTGDHDFIIIDCPGSDSPRVHQAMTLANTLVTPLNDSFIDLDLLGQVTPEHHRVEKLSFFADTVWQARQQRAVAKLPALDWVVVRNRLTMLDARNKRRVNEALDDLQGRVACRYVPGLAERVIYRELFPAGLTLVDLGPAQLGDTALPKLTTSHLAARQELRNFINALNLPLAGTTSEGQET